MRTILKLARLSAVFVLAAMPAAAQVNPSSAAPPRIALCKQGDVRGMWMLKRIFETPAGAWSEDFRQYPYQYRLFDPGAKKLYFEIKGEQQYKNGKQLRKAMVTAGAATPRQYVIGEKGALYFYENSAHKSTFYCGIVQESRAPYEIGDLVLTSADTASSQIFMLYGRPEYPGQKKRKPPQRPNAPSFGNQGNLNFKMP